MATPARTAPSTRIGVGLGVELGEELGVGVRLQRGLRVGKCAPLVAPHWNRLSPLSFSCWRCNALECSTREFGREMHEEPDGGDAKN